MEGKEWGVKGRREERNGEGKVRERGGKVKSLPSKHSGYGLV